MIPCTFLEEEKNVVSERGCWRLLTIAQYKYNDVFRVNLWPFDWDEEPTVSISISMSEKRLQTRRSNGVWKMAEKPLKV